MVRALRTDNYDRLAYLRVILREWFYDSLTLVPVLCIAGAFLLAGVMWRVQRFVSMQVAEPSWLLGGTASAISVTSVIASSMLSFLAVVFSVSLVALQLASQQFSPRVLRTFVRSTIAKVTLGLATGTFAYSLLLLYFGINRLEASVPLPAVAVDVLLVFVTTIAFVMFVKKVVTMMRIGYIISIITAETHASIRGLFPSEEAYHDCPAITFGDPSQVVQYRPGRAWSPLPKEAEGVFQGVNNQHLVQLARENNCTLRVLPRTGDYIVVGDPVLEVYGDAQLSPQQCLSTFFVEPERTLEQDPAYGFRALVDIALQALSPAVNAPTTATQVLYRLTALLSDIAKRPPPTEYYADEIDTVRLVRPVVAWPEYVDLAFKEIIEFGATSSQVCATLECAIDELLAKVPAYCRPPLDVQKRALLEMIRTP